MSIQTASLNSGSNGNCYYVGNPHNAVLIDAGLSCRETEIRMRKLELDIHSVKAIFISHEHTDHIKGLSTLAHKYSLPVYITSKTAGNGPRLIRHLAVPFRDEEPVQVGDLTIIPFSKAHDAIDPHSFIIRRKNLVVGVLTDIGEPCHKLIHYFKQCHAAFLESNYDEDMLENGRYPIHLKNRIRGGNGHLSNKQALDLFINHRAPYLSHLFLSHLSQHNNSPEIVKNLFSTHAKGTMIEIASRHEATGVYTIQSECGDDHVPLQKPVQMNLFA